MSCGVTRTRFAPPRPRSQRTLPSSTYCTPSSEATVVRGNRKSTRLNSSHLVISYAVFCLKKKKCLTTIEHTRQLHPHKAKGSVIRSLRRAMYTGGRRCTASKHDRSRTTPDESRTHSRLEV